MAMSAAELGLPLEAKLHPPVRHPEWADRRDLVRRLAGCRGRLVLIEAPAGYGKTVLAAQWHASPLEDRPFAWVSLDSGDNDPVRLWRHLTWALQRASPELNLAGAAEALRARAPDIAGGILPVLANELARLPAQVILLLDGYDSVSEPACQEQVGFLLGHVQQSLQLAITTRTDPALPLARLRVAGDIAEIGTAELRLARGEADSVVRVVAHLGLHERDLAGLLDRTEGWPAGVYLAALSLTDHPSPSAIPRRFTGSNRYIADFLTEEVLSGQPGPIQQFLERTAILGRFTAPLCDAVAGLGKADEIIEILERDNLFIVRLDDERLWFRYHHLFRQVLLDRLSRTEPGIVPELHARASIWHQQSGSTDEAIGHALSAGDVARAINLIATHWGGYASGGRIADVAEWLRILGKSRIAASPVAAHCAAWVAALSGDRRSARKWLAVMEAAHRDGPLPDGAISLGFSAALLHGTFGFDGLRVARESAAEAARLADYPASPWYAAARAAYGWDLYLSGEAEQARTVLREALAADSQIPSARTLALAAMSLVASDAGLAAQAGSLAQAAAELLTETEQRDAPQAALVYLAAGSVHAAQGRVADARGELRQALRIHPRSHSSSPWVTVETQLRLAQVLLGLGDHEAAGQLLQEVGEVLRALPDGTEALRARLARLEQLAAAPRIQPPVEPLSERELAILRLLRGSLSRREIGQELGLSVNTIKTYTRVIYRKLGVGTREEAVARALYLGII
jgi:LuxR family maltose regulon positive regulatory protein